MKLPEERPDFISTDATYGIRVMISDVVKPKKRKRKGIAKKKKEVIRSPVPPCVGRGCLLPPP